MSLIPESALAKLRQVVADSLPDSCTIQRKSLNGLTKTWPTLAIVPCRVLTYAKQRALEQYHLNEPAADVDAEIIVEIGTDVTPADRVVVNGTTYEVIRVSPTRSYEVRRRMLVRRER